MSVHVPPHRWADAFAGKLPAAEAAEMAHHAERCQKCARARKRIERASQSYPALRAMTPPDVSWDSVRARIHWSVSTERRAKLRPPGQIGRWIAVGAVAAGGIALVLSGDSAKLPTNREAPVIAHREDVPAGPAQLSGLVSRIAGEVMIDGVRGDAFDRAIAAGTMLATSDGRIDVQFGDASAFALGPRSSLDVTRLDAQQIELKVEGTLDVVVAPRAAGQRFLVHAGDDTVEVRGTQFRVIHDRAGTRVACRHGLVAVRDARGELDVPAGHEIAVTDLLASAHVVVMSTDELEEVARATPAVMPWTDAASLAKTSAALEIATAGRRDVRVDGVELGAAPLRVRVMPGRHTVEAKDRSGRFRRIGWVDVALAKPARLEVPAEVVVVPPTGGAAVRRAQLRAGLAQVRTQMSRCSRAAAKDDITHTYAVIDIEVDAKGNVNMLNVIDTELDQGCVHEALSQIAFPPGPAASWRERLDNL